MSTSPLEASPLVPVDPLEHTSIIETFQRFGLVAQSAIMRRCLMRLADARTSKSLLLIGEAGTERESAGRALFELSGASGAFHVVRDADRLMGQGTENDGLFVPDVMDLSLVQQAALLQCLNRRSNRLTIAAAPPDLYSAVRAGFVRQDLYYALAVDTLVIPPLRLRLEDLPLLATHILGPERAAQLKETDMIAYSAYSWPGNVAEFAHALRSGAVPTHVDAPVSERDGHGDGPEGGQVRVKATTAALEWSLRFSRFDVNNTGEGRRVFGGVSAASSESSGGHVANMSHRALLYRLKKHNLS